MAILDGTSLSSGGTETTFEDTSSISVDSGSFDFTADDLKDDDDEPDFSTTTTSTDRNDSSGSSTTSTTSTTSETDLASRGGDPTENKLAAYITERTFAAEDALMTGVGGATTGDVLGNLELDLLQTGGERTRQAIQETEAFVADRTASVEDVQERAQELVVQVTGADQGTSRWVVIGAAALAGVAALGSLVGLATEG